MTVFSKRSLRGPAVLAVALGLVMLGGGAGPAVLAQVAGAPLCLGADEALAPEPSLTPAPMPSPSAVQTPALSPTRAPQPSAAVVGLLAASPSAVASSAPTPAPTPLPVPPLGASTVTDTKGASLDLFTTDAGTDPAGVAVDATDTWGRVFVASRGSGTVTSYFGRSADLAVSCRLGVSGQPWDVAVDDATGQVLVTMRDRPALLVLDGRSSEMTQLASVDLPGVPGQVVIDQLGRRAYVTLPEAGLVAVLAPAEASTWSVVSTVAAGDWPTFLALDPGRARMVVGAQGQSPSVVEDTGKGSILVFDLSSGTPVVVGEPIPASVPTGVVIDPATGAATVLENGSDGLVTLVWPASVAGAAPVPQVTHVGLPFQDEGQNLNPVDVILLAGTRELIVTLAAAIATPIGGHLDAFLLDDTGRPTYERSIPGAQRARGIALDPVTGRIFVTQIDAGRLAAYAGADTPSAPPPPPASLVESMPSPLQISLAPADVARTFGMSLLVLLLVGAPTPLFNETLEAHLEEIEGWTRRLVGREEGSRSAIGRFFGRLAVGARRLSSGLVGITIYTIAAALIYSFLTPGFPFKDGLLVFGVTLLSLAVATIADILPGDRYVVRRYRSHGTIRVAMWTLVLAGICVFISRLANLDPGYMYGIIGTFVFTVALSRADEGKMEAWGGLALLLLGIAAWFARIPFQSPPGVPASGVSMIINSALVGIFVVCVLGLVFGLIPLNFLPGQKIFRWHKAVWIALWAAGLALFAHVLVYPVTVAQPNPSPASLQTTLTSVLIYGAIAIGFWAAFRWRDGRLARSGGGEGGEGGGEGGEGAEVAEGVEGADPEA